MIACVCSAGSPRRSRIGRAVFTPASLLTLAFGIALVEKWNLGYSSSWIDCSLVVWAASFALGAFVIGPGSAKVRRLIDERGVEDALVRQRIERILRFARVDAAMLLLVVVDMVAKPTF